MIKQVSYKCVKAEPNDLQKVRVCEGNQQSINCGKRKIDVEYANYGRLKGGHVCGIFSWDKDCKAENSLSVVKEDCQDEHSCVLEANNDKFGGNPCWLTSKYLEVSNVEIVDYEYQWSVEWILLRTLSLTKSSNSFATRNVQIECLRFFSLLNLGEGFSRDCTILLVFLTVPNRPTLTFIRNFRRHLFIETYTPRKGFFIASGRGSYARM